MDDLKTDVDAHLRKLRSADTQATAIAWMKKAYTLLEQCVRELDDRPVKHVQHERLVFVPERPKLEVVQSVSAFDLAAAKVRREELRLRSMEQTGTVVYPSIFLPPGLKPLPKPWKREDTARLERAAKLGKQAIQRRGR